MTVLTRQPATQDFLSPLGFQFVLLKAPAVNFFVQTVDLPGLTLGVSESPTPFTKLKFPGTQVEFTHLNVTFRVDEKLQSYMEIYNWMKGIGFPDSFDQYAALAADKSHTNGVFSDISLVILSNEKNPIFTARFIDTFPIMLSPLHFDTTQQTLDYLTADTTFAYRSYDITSA